VRLSTNRSRGELKNSEEMLSKKLDKLGISREELENLGGLIRDMESRMGELSKKVVELEDRSHEISKA